jgi:hypothetical protein
MSDDPTPKLEEELEMRRWAEERLIKLGSLLEIAESRDIDVSGARTNYYAARNELYTEKEPLKSMEDADKGMEQLTRELNRHKFKFFGLPRWTYLSFVIAKYGLFSMFYGMAAAIFFGYLLYSQDTNKIILNVPIWAALIAGLGASAQIMVGTVEDIKAYGIVREYKRLWYTSLPFLAVIFGFIAYLLTDLGMTTTGGSAVGSLNATGLGVLNLTGLEDAQLNNSILNASSAKELSAQSVSSFEVNGDNTRILFCFLVGFATNAFIEKLGKLSEKL